MTSIYPWLVQCFVCGIERTRTVEEAAGDERLNIVDRERPAGHQDPGQGDRGDIEERAEI